MTTETPTDTFRSGDRVEWRSDGRIDHGAYIGPDDGPQIGEGAFARVDTVAGEWLVRTHLLHPAGVLAAEDAELAELIERAKAWPLGDDAHAEHCRRAGFPWCDTCKLPAVFMEGQGYLHSTAEYPFGVHESMDDSGHEVTTREWWRVPR
jgi:hypothetical protein